LQGAHHYLGGRFVPPAVRDAFGLAALPRFPGAAQCVRLPSNPRPAGSGPDADAASGDAGPAVAAMRLTYQRGELLESDAAADPMTQFDVWFREAVAAKARPATQPAPTLSFSLSRSPPGRLPAVAPFGSASSPLTSTLHA
jgi:NAD(P)H-hydrate epimerase